VQTSDFFLYIEATPLPSKNEPNYSCEPELRTGNSSE
jgi:hypothetical protein